MVSNSLCSMSFDVVQTTIFRDMLTPSVFISSLIIKMRGSGILPACRIRFVSSPSLRCVMDWAISFNSNLVLIS